MKNATIVLMFVLCGFQSNSQSPENKGNGIFRIHMFYSSDQNKKTERFRQIDSETSYFDLKGNSSYRFGINGEWRGDSNFALVSGMNYAIRSFDAIYFCALCGDGREEYTLQFIEVPVYAKYYVPMGKFAPFMELGVLNQFKQKGRYESEFLLSGKLGVGTEYTIVEKIGVQLAVEYNRAITKLYDSKYFKNEILGIRIGLVFDL